MNFVAKQRVQLRPALCPLYTARAVAPCRSAAAWHCVIAGSTCRLLNR
jgi:hypothetical protein